MKQQITLKELRRMIREAAQADWYTGEGAWESPDDTVDEFEIWQDELRDLTDQEYDLEDARYAWDEGFTPEQFADQIEREAN